jgi:phosphonate transport system substrate-binding protein
LFEVKPGDSFGRIAAHVTGDPARWRLLWHPQKSGLPNPNLIHAGTQFELVKDPDGSQYLRLVQAGAARQAQAAPSQPLAAAKPVAAAPAAKVPATLALGLLPNIPAGALTQQNEPLKRYLERLNGNEVTLGIAANFRAHFESIMKGEYDLAVTASHFARVAQLDGKFVPIAIYEPRIPALLIGAKESGIAAATDLKGKMLVFQNPQSLVAMFATQWLRGQGLETGRDIEVKPVRTDIGAGRMILTGEAAGAIMSGGEFRQIPPADAERLRVVAELARIPNFVVLAHPRLGADVIARLRGQFHQLSADAGDGAAFAKAAGVAKVVDADERQMAELDPYVEATRRAMGLTK